MPVSAKRSATRRALWVVLGTLFLLIAAIGVVLPVLPTTPFLLLTAGCYARGSTRFHHWLLNNRVFGRYLRDYYEGQGIPLRTKAVSLLFLWGVILWSAWRIQQWHAALALIAIALAVSAHILTRPGRHA
jgi:hypothetical protein